MANMRRLPGLRFETEAPPLAESLPRMDIPAFVGFTARGPLHTPVAIEDIARFHDIFGEDAVLARSEEQDEPLRAYLAPAVRAFFRNGGKRCWVIRVAAKAATNQYVVPNLLGLGSHGTLTPAIASARCEGSWADSLRLSSALEVETIPSFQVILDPPQILLPAAVSKSVASGDLLRIRWSVSGGGQLWAEVASVKPVTAASPPAGVGPLLAVVCNRTFLEVGSPLTAPPLHIPLGQWLVERVTLQLWVRAGQDQLTRLGGLGFAPAHPRYWAALPTDRRIFGEPIDEEQPDALQRQLLAEALSPRFPLAGPGVSDATLFLPIGMDVLPGTEAEAVAQSASPIQRDGLAVLTADLFMESRLADSTIFDLASKADYWRYQAPASDNKPRPLHGIHAAFYLDEVTILAVPDAVQRGWDEIEPTPIGTPPVSSPPPRPDWWRFLDCQTPQDVPLVSTPPGYGFIACDAKAIDAPLLNASKPAAEGSFTLSWTPLKGTVDVLEEAADPLFANRVEISRTARGSFTMWGKRPGDYYYRLYRIGGATRSNYSNTVAIRISLAGSAIEKAARFFDESVLLDVHRAMLRMCAARGDMFAVLTLPRHYREEQSFAYASALRSAGSQAGIVPPLTEQNGLLSFGALNHPWLTGREENLVDELRTTPPDGAVAGILARRALARGAWIAPANERLRGVVALEPSIDRQFYQSFLDTQINLWRQEPEGFLALSSDTLSEDAGYRPINVRRLLALLRRLVLRTGVDYVFEPNNDQFRRQLKRGVESVLEGLYRQGAFAGRTAASAFQVVTDSSVNPPQSLIEGKFITEIRVAPSVPLNFLTVRLLQTAERLSVTEGS